jgi:hypothetical protein
MDSILTLKPGLGYEIMYPRHAYLRSTPRMQQVGLRCAGPLYILTRKELLALRTSLTPAVWTS